MEVVIAGDIVNSQKNDPERYLGVLTAVLREFSKDGLYQIYRGDSFQALISQPVLALHASIKLKAALKQIESLDVRVAIGLGEVSLIDNNISISTGSALTRSGELLDSLKAEGQNLMVSANHKLDHYFNLTLRMASLYMDDWTESGAAAITTVMEYPGLTQEEIGKILGVQQATASRRLNRANWKETNALLDQFTQYYKDVSHDSIL